MGSGSLLLFLVLLGLLKPGITAPSVKTVQQQTSLPVREKEVSYSDGGNVSAVRIAHVVESSNGTDDEPMPAAYEFPNAINVTDNDQSLIVRQNPPASQVCECYYQDSCGCLCRQPISWEDFQLLPQNFRSCPGFTLALRGGQFHSFPADYFYRVGAVKEFVLDISGISFQYLLDPGGDASPLNRVSFDTSAFIRAYQVTVSQSWNWAGFNDLTPTRRLSYCEVQIVQSSVRILTQDFGRICKGAVTVVNVNYCNMMALENRVFVPFYKLNEVDLSNNRLRVMLRSYFSNPANELESINLSYNDIRSLPNDMFSNMPALSSVDLKGNPITTLQESTFRPIFRNVDILGLETMPLSCDCNSKWLKEPYQQCGANVYRLAETVCQTPSKLQGLSFFNETLAKDLVC